MIFQTPEFFKKVLVLGSGSVANRAPLLVGELLRKCEDTIRLSRTYFSRCHGQGNFLSKLAMKVLGAILYHLLLPIAIFRSQMVFLLPSNNTEMTVIAFWARILRRPVLVDYYVSIFEWSCFMQCSTSPSSKLGRRLLRADRLAHEAAGVIHCNRVEWAHIAEVIGLPIREKGFYRLPLFTNFDQLVEKVQPTPANAPFVFGWWGSSMPLHGLNTIFEAFCLLAKERQDFELHLCFWGEIRRKQFEQGKDVASMPWLLIHDDLIAADGSLPKFINERVHVGFSHFGTGPTADYVYTNKVLECMALGRTALVARSPGNYEYGDIEKFFFACDPTVESLVGAARRAIDDQEARREKEAHCVVEFAAKYSETAAKNQFHQILDQFYADVKSQSARVP